MGDAKDFVLFILAVILTVSILLGVVFAIINIGELPTCNQLAIGSDYEYRWGFWTGCVVNVDGIWIHAGDVHYNALQGQLELDD